MNVRMGLAERRALGLLGIFGWIAVLGAACTDKRPCRDNSVLLSFTFDQQTKAADELDITITVGDQSKTFTKTRAPNRMSDALEIDYSMYKTGAHVSVQVEARSSATATMLGSAMVDGALIQRCTPIQVPLVVGGAGAGGSGAAGSGAGTGGNAGNVGSGGAGGGGVCADGTTCSLPNMPCHVGRISCDTGLAVCTDSGVLQSSGADCGTGMVCSADGSCGKCAANAACDLMQDCKVGRTNCATGTPVCMEAGTASDGAPCKAGNGFVCESGACVACTNNSTCLPMNSCHKGSLMCGGAMPVCTDLQTNLDDGMDCGTDKVCFKGTCNACKAGMTCALADQPCRTGQIVCNTGQPVCVEAGNASDGKDCETGKVCKAGACVACMADAPCEPAGNKCHVGSLSCANGVAMCTDTSVAVTNGTPCGDNQVCYNGMCSACVANQDCTPPSTMCKAGKTSCTTGQSVCLQSGAAPNGSSCGGNLVCSMGSCVTCTVGPCTPTMASCHMGTLSCANGSATCMDLGTSMPNGNTCGTDLVCKGGSCVTCKEDPCVPATCQQGKFSCATGSAVCTKTGNDMDGKDCSGGSGSGKVCMGGACVTCMSGTACQPTSNPCNKGMLDCSTGVSKCMDLGVPASNGTTCGTNLACAAGMCNCTQGTTCPMPGNLCKTGTTSCATGSSACGNFVNANDSAACEAGKSCSAGACVASASCMTQPTAGGCPCPAANTFGCNGNQPLACNTVSGQSGFAWQNKGSACDGTTTTCDSSAGTCKSLVSGAPSAVTATQQAGYGAKVTWAAPNPSTNVTGYTVTATASGDSKMTPSIGVALTASFAGLMAGKSYTFTVVANSAGGPSASSSASGAITAADVPGAPTGVSASAAAGSKATVSWTAPSSNFNPITGYKITSSPGGFTATSTTTSAQVSGLSPGSSYTFTVVATNGLGDGPSSAMSNSVVAGDVPGAPTNVVGTAMSGGKVSLSWNAPAGATVTSYVVSATPSITPVSVTTTSTTISSLTVGASYTFSVRADNALGMGGTGTSSPVLIADVPGAPVVTATTKGLQGQISWTAPAANGSAITGYTITSSPAGVNQSVNGSATMTTARLTQGIAYTFSVKATNGIGTGPAGTSGQVTPTCTSTSMTLPALGATATVQYGSTSWDTPSYAFVNAAYGGGYDTTGWTQFDLSVFPNWSVVTGAKFILPPVSTSTNSPVIRVDYSDHDGWTRANASPTSVPRTTTVTGTFAPSSATQLIDLDLVAHDLTLDMVANDSVVTLGITNTNHSVVGSAVTQAQYGGSDGSDGTMAPHLTVTVCR